MIVNSFQLPNELVDQHMADMPPLALKCYLFIVRKTVGWQKDRDRIAQSQFIEFTGAQKSAVSDSVRWLEDHNLIIRHMDKGKITEYELNRSSKPAERVGDEKVNRHSGSSKPAQRNDPPATAVTTKDTITKLTIQKEKKSPSKPEGKKTNKSIMPRIFEAVATKYLIARQEQWPKIVQGSKLNTVCITLANLDISEDPDDPIHDQVISAINHAVQTGEYTEFHRKPITSAIEAAYLVVSSKPEPDKPKPQQTCHHCPDPAALPNGLCIACNSRATS